jgi:hypothetical protein
MDKRSQNTATCGERFLKSAQKLRKEDSWGPIDPEKSLDMGKYGVAAYSIANFIFQCCKEGKSLIPL